MSGVVIKTEVSVHKPEGRKWIESERRERTREWRERGTGESG